MVDPQLDGIKEPTARLAVITQNLYSTCYERVTRGVLHQVCDIVFVESLYRKVFICSRLFESCKLLKCSSQKEIKSYEFRRDCAKKEILCKLSILFLATQCSGKRQDIIFGKIHPK